MFNKKKVEEDIQPVSYFELRECKLCHKVYYYVFPCMDRLSIRTHKCDNGNIGNTEFVGYVLSKNVNEYIEKEC